MIKIKLATEKPIEDENHWSYPFSELDYLIEEKEDGAIFLLYDGRLYETDEDMDNFTEKFWEVVNEQYDYRDMLTFDEIRKILDNIKE